MEFTVSDLDQALLLFVGTIGLGLAFRGRHPTLDAEVAEVDAGPIRLNLVCPTDTGSGIPMDNPDTRLSQIDLECPSAADATELASRLVEAGASVVERAGLFFLDTSMTQSLLGSEAAFVFYPRLEGQVRAPSRPEPDPDS